MTIHFMNICNKQLLQQQIFFTHCVVKIFNHAQIIIKKLLKSKRKHSKLINFYPLRI